MLKLSPIFFILLLSSDIAIADFNQDKMKSFNSDFNRLNQIRQKANPRMKNIETLKKTKDQVFIKNLQDIVSDAEFNEITAEINSVNPVNAKSIDEQYLAHIESTKNSKLNEENQLMLNDLISSSNKKLTSGVDLDAKIKSNLKEVLSKQPMPEEFLASASAENNDEEEPASESADAANAKAQYATDKKRNLYQEEIIEGQAELAPSEKDTLFDTVSKAYLRNLNRLKTDY